MRLCVCFRLGSRGASCCCCCDPAMACAGRAHGVVGPLRLLSAARCVSAWPRTTRGRLFVRSWHARRVVLSNIRGLRHTRPARAVCGAQCSLTVDTDCRDSESAVRGTGQFADRRGRACCAPSPVWSYGFQHYGLLYSVLRSLVGGYALPWAPLWRSVIPHCGPHCETALPAL